MPYRFNYIGATTSQPQLIAQMNANFAKLDSEAAVKTFNGPNGQPVLISGELDHGFHGTAYKDENGNTVKLVGFDASGEFVEITVKDGEDAYTVLGY